MPGLSTRSLTHSALTKGEEACALGANAKIAKNKVSQKFMSAVSSVRAARERLFPGQICVIRYVRPVLLTSRPDRPRTHARFQWHWGENIGRLQRP